MTNDDGTYVVAVAPTITVAVPVVVPISISKVTITVAIPNPNIVVVVADAPPYPDSVVKNPSTDDPHLLGKAGLLMGQSRSGGAAGDHRIGAARKQRCAEESRGGHSRKQALVHFSASS